MPISSVAVGQFIYQSKLNELIRAVPEVQWVNFNGRTGVIRGAQGISTVTRLGDAIYRVSLTLPKPNNGYTVVASGSTMDGNDTGFIQLHLQTQAFFDLRLKNDNGSTVGDCEFVCAIVF